MGASLEVASFQPGREPGGEDGADSELPRETARRGGYCYPPLPLGNQDDDTSYCCTVVSGAIVVVSCIMLVVSATGAGVTSSAFF